MKKWVVFLLGFILGIVFTIGTLFFMATEHSEAEAEGVTMFESAGDCMSTKPFKVIQVIGEHHALALEREWSKVLNDYTNGDLLVLITNNDGMFYYDDQTVKVPNGKCWKQVGIYRYETQNNMLKTVPIVKLMDK